MSKIFNPTYYPTMILNLHSLARFAWGVALAHAGPPEEEQDGSLYLYASLALNPGGVNQKRPAENQVDFPKDYLGAEAHYAPLDLRKFDPATYVVLSLNLFLFSFSKL
jgi:hypothetical protein